MNQNKKNKLIILDYPVGFKFGIDLKYWETGPNFRGVKCIPDGIHYVYYGVKDDFCNTGFFVHFKEGQIAVKRWNSKDEDLTDYYPTESDIERYKSAQDEIDCYLGEYDMESHRNWWSISNFVEPDIVKMLMPRCGKLSSVDQFISTKSTIEDRKFATKPKLDKDGLVELELKPETKVNYLEIPRFLFPENCTNKSHYMMDKTYLLENFQPQLTSEELESRILAELQFSFISYNLSYQLSGLEQWLDVVDLLCNCVELIINKTDFFTKFITILHRQLSLTDDDFADITTNNNRFYKSLKQLFNNIDDIENLPQLQELQRRVKGMQQSIEHKYEWDFTEDADEDQPVIVQDIPNNLIFND